MKLPFFSAKFVSQLRESAQSNVGRYGVATPWLDSFAAGKAYVHESAQVVDPLPVLVIAADNNAQHDAENAKRIFTWLKNLTPALAMQERLWAYLTHCGFPEYMHARWPVEQASAVTRRYLFESQSFAAAYFGASRSLISVEGDHPFRRKPITHFGRRRSVISVQADHLFRMKPIMT